MQDLEKIRKVLCKELDNIDTSNLSINKLDVIDKITHSLKSIDTIMAMEESKHSNNSYGSYSYGREYSMGVEPGYSYRRNRDSMGRYSRAGENEELKMHLEDMLQTVSGDKKRMVERWINEL